jgi:ComF family protein
MAFLSFQPISRTLLRFLQHDCLLCGCSIHAEKSLLFGLCHHCHTSLIPITECCQRCALPLPASQPLCGRCIADPPGFLFAHSATRYEGPIRSLIYQMKYQHNKATIRLLAELFCHSFPAGPPPIDLLLPVPMHFRRNLERGNNQCDLLAAAIGQKLSIRCDHHALARIRATPTQQQLSATERKSNLKSAFRTKGKLAGLRIAILDDVHTTGSTMNEIAKTLKLAGAREVHAWSIARAVKE